MLRFDPRLWAYYAYRASTSLGFYVPVSVVYLLDSGFGLGFVALAQATFSVALLAAEVPTGYVADRLGRRGTLAAGNACGVGALLGYAVAEAAATFLVLKVVLAVGWALRSGTTDAWLYELLASVGETDRFATVEGRGSSVVLLTSAVTAVAGGLLYAADAAYPFLANAAVAVVGLPLLAIAGDGPGDDDAGADDNAGADDDDAGAGDDDAVLGDDDAVLGDDDAGLGDDDAGLGDDDAVLGDDDAGLGDDDAGLGGDDANDGGAVDTAAEADVPGDETFTMSDAARVLRLQVRRPAVRWVVAYTVVCFLVFDLTRTFEQPALRAAGLPVAGFGLLYAGFKLASAGVAAGVGPLQRWLGTRRVLGLAAPAIGAVYAALLAVPGSLAVVPVLFFYRGARTVLRPVLNQYLNDRLADVGRATVLSGVSMVLSLVGAVARLIAGEVVVLTGPIRLLGLVGVGLAGVAGVLWLAVDPVRPVPSPASDAVADGVPATD